jgi:hyperosmotically inducible periplasmic protein
MNSKGIYRSLACITLLFLSLGTFSQSQDSGQQNTEQNPATPDNTRVNQRDRNANTPTADRQQNARPDRDVTKQIRDAIIADKALSTYAHNVKVITQNGQVTLRGPVRSEEEKRAIEGKAAEIAGEGNVVSDLTVKPKP